uniref:Major facilitator superfamily (MFS) profile domain-containing protein n=1 Tax=Bionectria ochroleuca TaxID=29856 RepID=A0A0B7JU90_BIOOC
MGRESPEVAQANRSSDDFHTAAIRKEEATVTKTEADAQGGWDSDEPITTDAQAGVQQIEATTNVWTKGALIFAYVWIWIIYFVDSMQQGTTGALTPYVTSAFSSHSLTPTVGIISGIIGGVSRLTLAKILDVLGRPTGYLICVILTTLGLIMMAACRDVEMYAAAQVFYWVGYNGIGYCLTIFIADTSSLRNRGLMFAYANSPYIITMWLSGPISTAFLSGPGFRWAFGVFCIITPVITLPLWVLFVHYLKVARKQGILPERKSGRTALQSIWHYCREFDALGLLLITAGLSLFLLSFNIYTLQPLGWKAPIVIAFIVLGGLLIIAFAIWEKWFAPVTFIPYSLLTDRTVLGACILASTTFVSFYIWNSYFTSFLQVVNGLTITQSSYVASIYSIGSCFWGVVPDVNIGYVVMCQIFIAFAGGTTVITQQVAAMAAASHQHIAVVIAVESMFSNVGGAIGSTVSSAIWQNVFPRALARHLPEDEQPNLLLIYGNLTRQLSYLEGTPARIAIQESYAEGQRYMLIGATCILVVGLGAVAMWRDIDVKEKKQVKGLVI